MRPSVHIYLDVIPQPSNMYLVSNDGLKCIPKMDLSPMCSRPCTKSDEKVTGKKLQSFRKSDKQSFARPTITSTLKCRPAFTTQSLTLPDKNLKRIFIKSKRKTKPLKTACSRIYLSDQTRPKIGSMEETFSGTSNTKTTNKLIYNHRRQTARGQLYSEKPIQNNNARSSISFRNMVNTINNQTGDSTPREANCQNIARILNSHSNEYLYDLENRILKSLNEIKGSSGLQFRDRNTSNQADISPTSISSSYVQDSSLICLPNAGRREDKMLRNKRKLSNTRPTHVKTKGPYCTVTSASGKVTSSIDNISRDNDIDYMWCPLEAYLKLVKVPFLKNTRPSKGSNHLPVNSYRHLKLKTFSSKSSLTQGAGMFNNSTANHRQTPCLSQKNPKRNSATYQGEIVESLPINITFDEAKILLECIRRIKKKRKELGVRKTENPTQFYDGIEMCNASKLNHESDTTMPADTSSPSISCSLSQSCLEQELDTNKSHGIRCKRKSGRTNRRKSNGTVDLKENVDSCKIERMLGLGNDDIGQYLGDYCANKDQAGNISNMKENSRRGRDDLSFYRIDSGTHGNKLVFMDCVAPSDFRNSAIKGNLSVPVCSTGYESTIANPSCSTPRTSCKKNSPNCASKAVGCMNENRKKHTCESSIGGETIRKGTTEIKQNAEKHCEQDRFRPDLEELHGTDLKINNEPAQPSDTSDRCFEKRGNTILCQRCGSNPREQIPATDTFRFSELHCDTDTKHTQHNSGYCGLYQATFKDVKNKDASKITSPAQNGSFRKVLAGDSIICKNMPSTTKEPPYPCHETFDSEDRVQVAECENKAQTVNMTEDLVHVSANDLHKENKISHLKNKQQSENLTPLYATGQEVSRNISSQRRLGSPDKHSTANELIRTNKILREQLNKRITSSTMCTFKQQHRGDSACPHIFHMSDKPALTPCPHKIFKDVTTMTERKINIEWPFDLANGNSYAKDTFQTPTRNNGHHREMDSCNRPKLKETKYEKPKEEMYNKESKKSTIGTQQSVSYESSKSCNLSNHTFGSTYPNMHPECASWSFSTENTSPSSITQTLEELPKPPGTDIEDSFGDFQKTITEECCTPAADNTYAYCNERCTSFLTGHRVMKDASTITPSSWMYMAGGERELCERVGEQFAWTEYQNSKQTSNKRQSTKCELEKVESNQYFNIEISRAPFCDAEETRLRQESPITLARQTFPTVNHVDYGLHNARDKKRSVNHLALKSTMNSNQMKYNDESTVTSDIDNSNVDLLLQTTQTRTRDRQRTNDSRTKCKSAKTPTDVDTVYRVSSVVLPVTRNSRKKRFTQNAPVGPSNMSVVCHKPNKEPKMLYTHKANNLNKVFPKYVDSKSKSTTHCPQPTLTELICASQVSHDLSQCCDEACMTTDKQQNDPSRVRCKTYKLYSSKPTSVKALLPTYRTKNSSAATPLTILASSSNSRQKLRGSTWSKRQLNRTKNSSLNCDDILSNKNNSNGNNYNKNNNNNNNYNNNNNNNNNNINKREDCKYHINWGLDSLSRKTMPLKCLMDYACTIL